MWMWAILYAILFISFILKFEYYCRMAFENFVEINFGVSAELFDTIKGAFTACESEMP